MSPVFTPPVKAACLACRTSKTRCDGQNPCNSCSKRDRQCMYQPSRRGGPRRGIRYTNAYKSSNASKGSEPSLKPPDSLPLPEFSLDAIFGLISPLSGIRNLDVSPDGTMTSDQTTSLWNSGSSDNQNIHDMSHLHGLESPIIRTYESEEDIINAYYIFVHPYLPLLPPPIAPQYEDRSVPITITHQGPFQAQKSFLPHWPTSPLTFALSAILVLIPPPQGLGWANEATVRWRRSYAELYMSSALESVERIIDSLGPVSVGSYPSMELAQRNPIHSCVPVTVEPVLALVVASVYEYCQRGNITKMRTRANHAVTLAMDLGLHNLDSQASRFSDAQRRAWWVTMFMVYISSCVQVSAPVISINDPRITTPYPQFGFSLEPWPLIFKAQEALFASTKVASKLTSDHKRETPSPTIGDQIRDLDSAIKSMIIESDRSLRLNCQQGADASAAQNMWLIARLFIHASRLKLHRFRAFMDIPIFLENHCDIPSINVDNPELMPSTSRMTELEAVFPFTEQESSVICLKSSLATARIFHNLPNPALCNLAPETTIDRQSPNSVTTLFPPPIPYFAFRASADSGRLCTCYHLLSQPEPGTEVQDAERLMDELRNGVESLVTCMKPIVIFEGMSDMVREIENAWHAAFSELSQLENRNF
ncbi:hypothetical protein ASPWEDRAFT_179945 [Aspergillus wentii DTO 134E9]|uniref:Zn(2)-C6 fungal-type domain-containing protein n=1 Tax=Aspergillus wentii DTO 134E9 TaxID=1073089 RepID=A0A1L9RU42_ASPWE|nr:uncharacterized protein ASPWEDRAFT_179945 [Aspergillus wentii DTO 134E9]OJJ38388.1 hypothetical protein ASPWEDRAFT_179945 [Aspergillus wentii DTO 134E9]